MEEHGVIGFIALELFNGVIIASLVNWGGGFISHFLPKNDIIVSNIIKFPHLGLIYIELQNGLILLF